MKQQTPSAKTTLQAVNPKTPSIHRASLSATSKTPRQKSTFIVAVLVIKTSWSSLFLRLLLILTSTATVSNAPNANNSCTRTQRVSCGKIGFIAGKIIKSEWRCSGFVKKY